MLEFPLIRPECGAVVYRSSSFPPRRMFDMQHLMIEDVLENERLDACRVECPADRYGVVNLIVMPKNTPSA